MQASKTPKKLTSVVGKHAFFGGIIRKYYHLEKVKVLLLTRRAKVLVLREMKLGQPGVPKLELKNLSFYIGIIFKRGVTTASVTNGCILGNDDCNWTAQLL